MTITVEDLNCQGVSGVYHRYLYENGIVEAPDLRFYAAEEENVMTAFKGAKSGLILAQIGHPNQFRGNI